MARQGAGYRYPHATTDQRTHDHRFCAVVAAIAEAAESGAESWGTVHEFPLESADEAEAARLGMYRARRHGHSVRANWRRSGKGYVLSVQVWTRDMAKQHIIDRANRGERLPYNVMRG